MKIEPIALYVTDLEVLSGPRTGVTQKSRACGENPQVSALFVMDLSARQHHDARRSK